MAYFSLKDLPEEYRRQALEQLKEYDSPFPLEAEYTNEELVRSLTAKSKSKYNAEKTELDGQRFDSKKEANRYRELSMMEKAGEIHDLQTQVKFVLIPAQKKDGKVIEREVSYYADFAYYKDGEYVVEDVKGYKKGQAYALFKLKRKLMLYMHGVIVKEI